MNESKLSAQDIINNVSMKMDFLAEVSVAMGMSNFGFSQLAFEGLNRILVDAENELQRAVEAIDDITDLPAPQDAIPITKKAKSG